MSKQLKYTDSIEFDKAVGVLDEDQLIELGWPVNNGNRICYSQHQQLMELIEILNAEPNGEKYHIATDINPYSDELIACTVNRVAYCDRLDYYLCKGDDDENIYLEELRSDYD